LDGVTGPRGRKAQDAGNQTVELTSGLGIGVVVAIKADGSMIAGLADDILTSQVLGVVIDGRLVQTEGPVTRTSWSLTPGLPVWLSTTVAGQVTQVAPTTVGQVVARIGLATKSNEIDLEIAQPILL
jgi:hypothetical protein